MNSRQRIPATLLIGTCGICGLFLLHTARTQIWLARTGSASPAKRIGVTASASSSPQSVLLPHQDITAKPAAESHFAWHVGGPTPAGDFVFADWEEGHLYLLSDYGFMLINEGTYEHPKAVYLLGFRRQKRVVVCRSLPAFRQALKEIPRNTKVYLHTVCTAGTSPGMHEETWKPIESAFRAAHLRFRADDHVMYCICAPSADPYPNVPRALKPAYVHLYGPSTFAAHTEEGEE